MTNVVVFTFDNVKEGTELEFKDVDKVIIPKDGILTIVKGNVLTNFNLKFVINWTITEI